MLILDGKATAAYIREELAQKVRALHNTKGRAPGLCVILVGEDPASQVYVRNKEKACAQVGITSTAYHLDADATQNKLFTLIDTLNADPKVDGILLQLPLPKHLNALSCLERIHPNKDVDGFHPTNMGRLTLGLPSLRPCTPAGIMELLNHYKLSVAGKKAVVVGRSNIVGKPLAIMLSAPEANATVTLCHSGTPNMKEVCQEADILCVAIGKPKFITKDMVKPGAIVIDVGINRTEQGLCGDCDYEPVSQIASAITPVPGGIGPMTIAMLLKNTIIAFENK